MTRSRRRQQNMLTRVKKLPYYKTRSSTRSSGVNVNIDKNSSSDFTNEFSQSVTVENTSSCVESSQSGCNISKDINDSPQPDTHESLNNQDHLFDDDIIVLDSQNVTNDTQDFNLYCYSNCQLGRKYHNEMIQCATCMSMFHSECSDAVSGKIIWNCNKCRNVSNDIDCLKNQITELHDILSVMVQKQKDFYSNICDLSFANNQLKQEVKLLKKQNHQLRIKQYNRLSSDTSSSGSESSSDDDSIDGTTTTTRPHHSRDGLSEQHSFYSSDESRLVPVAWYQWYVSSN